jgi:hypothetical protein
VNPDDLFPVVDISALVDVYPTRVPVFEQGPQHYPNTRPASPRTPEYFSRYDDDDDFPLEETLSPTPIPRRAPASPTPPTPPSPPNPLCYRAGPTPTPPRPIKKISKRKAITIEQRAAERKRKPREKKGRYCKVCRLECNSLIAFADHVKSRGHVYRASLTDEHPHYDACNRDFPDKKQLEDHKRGKPHMGVVTQSSR